jgi:hypothetical protein
MTQNLNDIKPISVFEEHILRAARLGAGMANSLAMDIAIKALQAEESQVSDTIGAPSYYDTARFGLLWHELASDTVGES